MGWPCSSKNSATSLRMLTSATVWLARNSSAAWASMAWPLMLTVAPLKKYRLRRVFSTCAACNVLCAPSAMRSVQMATLVAGCAAHKSDSEASGSLAVKRPVSAVSCSWAAALHESLRSIRHLRRWSRFSSSGWGATESLARQRRGERKIKWFFREPKTEMQLALHYGVESVKKLVLLAFFSTAGLSAESKKDEKRALCARRCSNN